MQVLAISGNLTQNRTTGIQRNKQQAQLQNLQSTQVPLVHPNVTFKGYGEAFNAAALKIRDFDLPNIKDVNNLFKKLLAGIYEEPGLINWSEKYNTYSTKMNLTKLDTYDGAFAGVPFTLRRAREIIRDRKLSNFTPIMKDSNNRHLLEFIDDGLRFNNPSSRFKDNIEFILKKGETEVSYNNDTQRKAILYYDDYFSPGYRKMETDIHYNTSIGTSMDIGHDVSKTYYNKDGSERVLRSIIGSLWGI